MKFLKKIIGMYFVQLTESWSVKYIHALDLVSPCQSWETNIHKNQILLETKKSLVIDKEFKKIV